MMNTAPTATLFLSTYEMPRHLELVFAALERQSTFDFEVMVCDDGSGPETKTRTQQFAQRAPFPVKHFWQEHRGFRKCKILNQALREARGHVMVFLDGDCVPHRDYLRDHIEQQEPGRYLAGRRVDLGQKISESLRVEQVRQGFFDFPKWRLIWSAVLGDSTHLQRTVRIPWGSLRRKLKMEQIDDLKGCNYSVSRKDLLAINGFDEEYEGYGREDTDIELRLQNLGLKIKSLKGLALQFHVWHPRRDFTPANDSRLEEVKRTKRTWCEKGVNLGQSQNR